MGSDTFAILMGCAVFAFVGWIASDLYQRISKIYQLMGERLQREAEMTKAVQAAVREIEDRLKRLEERR
jgi:type II secretory pathway component PulJ